MVELCARYWKFASTYYVKNGERSKALAALKRNAELRFQNGFEVVPQGPIVLSFFDFLDVIVGVTPGEENADHLLTESLESERAKFNRRRRPQSWQRLRRGTHSSKVLTSLVADDGRPTAFYFAIDVQSNVSSFALADATQVGSTNGPYTNLN